MLRLKENLVDFLRRFVKEERVSEIIREIRIGRETCGIKQRYLYAEDTNDGVNIAIFFDENDFEEAEELKLYVWYPREKFEGNPNKYWLVESDSKKHCKIYTAPYQTERLSPTADYFMYIEPLEVEDEDL